MASPAQTVAEVFNRKFIGCHGGTRASLLRYGTMPCEVPNTPFRFEARHPGMPHTTRRAVSKYWQILACGRSSTERISVSAFWGRSSPVHFFLGEFRSLAVDRAFSWESGTGVVGGRLYHSLKRIRPRGTVVAGFWPGPVRTSKAALAFYLRTAAPAETLPVSPSDAWLTGPDACRFYDPQLKEILLLGTT